jgi:hypothetical protein
MPTADIDVAAHHKEKAWPHEVWPGKQVSEGATFKLHRSGVTSDYTVRGNGEFNLVKRREREVNVLGRLLANDEPHRSPHDELLRARTGAQRRRQNFLIRKRHPRALGRTGNVTAPTSTASVAAILHRAGFLKRVPIAAEPTT